MAKSLCVFCGSKTGNNTRVIQAVEELSQLIVKTQSKLVYGGASVGIMGELANRILAKGGEVIGVMPRFMKDLEVAHDHLSKMYWVESMHERKQKMYELSDVFLALPGGFGTLDELFEILTWKQLRHHQKEIFVLNVENYFQHLTAQVQKMVDFGFVSKEHQAYFNLISDLHLLKL